VSFAQAAQQLAQYAVDLSPAGDVTIPARDVLDMTFFYRCQCHAARHIACAVECLECTSFEHCVWDSPLHTRERLSECACGVHIGGVLEHRLWLQFKHN